MSTDTLKVPYVDWLPDPSPSDFPARMLIDWIWYKPL